MSNLSVLAAILALAALSACRSAPSGSDGFRTLAIGYQTGLSGEGLRVARSANEWSALWREHTSQALPRPDAPEVDFERDVVVIVLAGDRPTGGYGIEVLDATFDGKALVLGARETVPAPDAIVPMVVTRPYHLIATPRTDATFRLVVR
jgi:hypothetical protein